MALINVIATGSSGNLYEIIDKKGESILLEAGVNRTMYIKNREAKVPPQMCIISHKHGDHAYFSNEYEMITTVHKWEQTAESKDFRAFGFEVEHGGVLNYAYLIELKNDNQMLFFATDLMYEIESINTIVEGLKFMETQNKAVNNFLIECNYNDYLYHKATAEQRVGCDRHFSDNDVVNFIRAVNPKAPKIITIHGSNRLSADTYTKNYIQNALPNAVVMVATGVKGKTKDLFYI